MRPQISERCRAQQRVRHRVTDDVSLGMSLQPRLVLEPHAGKDERRLVAARMHVESEAEPKLSHQDPPAKRPSSDPRRW